MKITTLAFWFCLIQLTSFCQETQLRYGVSLYPYFSKGFATASDTNSSYYTGVSTMSPNYSIGLLIDLERKSHWGVSLGFNYLRTGDRSKLFPWDPNRGFPSRTYKHWHDYLELSLNTFRTFKAHWIIELGVSPQINIRNEVRYFHEGHGDPFEMEITKQQINSKFGMSANFGFGYTINADHFFIKIMPYAQFNFIRPMNTYEFQLGGVGFDYLPARNYANFGIRISFMLRN